MGKEVKMTRMLLQYKVMPNTDADVDFDELKSFVESVTKNYDSSVKDIKLSEAPLGFGLKAVRVEFKVNELMGTEKFENLLKENSMVGEVQIEKMDRM